MNTRQIIKFAYNLTRNKFVDLVYSIVNQYFADYDFQYVKLNDDEVKTINLLIKVNPNLKSLNFNKAHMSDASFIILAKTIQDNQSITALNLSGFRFTANATTALENIIVYNNTLIELDLRNCTYLNDSQQKLAFALAKNSTLKHLYLSWESLQATVLVDIIKLNQGLTAINASNFTIPENLQKSLFEALQNNYALTSLETRVNNPDCTFEKQKQAVLQRNREMAKNILGLSILLSQARANLVTDKGISYLGILPLEIVLQIFNYLIQPNSTLAETCRNMLINTVPAQQFIGLAHFADQPSNANPGNKAYSSDHVLFKQKPSVKHCNLQLTLKKTCTIL